MTEKESIISTILNQFHQLKPLLVCLGSSQGASKETILTCQPSLQYRGNHIITSNPIIDASMRTGRRVSTPLTPQQKNSVKSYVGSTCTNFKPLKQSFGSLNIQSQLHFLKTKPYNLVNTFCILCFFVICR